jgi:hypothetical protein
MKKGEKKVEVDVGKVVSSHPSLKEELVLLGIFLVIAIVFFALLNSKVDTGFGLKEILFAIAFAFLMTAFLMWIRSMSLKHAYMGLGTGIVGVLILGYGFALRYKGPYSSAFMIITGIVALGYFGWNFWKFRLRDKYIVGEFDDG